MRRRGLFAIAIVLPITGWLLWTCRPSPVSEPPGTSVIVAITPFRALGSQMEPWSGVGLAQEVQAALDTIAGWTARVADDSGRVAGDYLLGGSIARQGSRREVGVELIRLPERTILWTGTYWRTEADLGSFTKELAHAVALAIDLDKKKGALTR